MCRIHTFIYPHPLHLLTLEPALKKHELWHALIGWSKSKFSFGPWKLLLDERRRSTTTTTTITNLGINRWHSLVGWLVKNSSKIVTWAPYWHPKGVNDTYYTQMSKYDKYHAHSVFYIEVVEITKVYLLHTCVMNQRPICPNLMRTQKKPHYIICRQNQMLTSIHWNGCK